MGHDAAGLGFGNLELQNFKTYKKVEMKATTWFRITAVLMLLFAAGHTFGFLSFRATTDEGRAVFDAMNRVHFSEGHSTFSYGEFYRGFGLSITVSQLFFAWLAWTLAWMSKEGAAGVKDIAWGMVVLQLVGVLLSAKYFATIPALFSLMAAGCFAMGAMSVRKSIAAVAR